MAVTTGNHSDAHCHDFSPSCTTLIYLFLRCGGPSSCISFHTHCCLDCGRCVCQTAGTKKRDEQNVCNKPSRFSKAAIGLSLLV